MNPRRIRLVRLPDMTTSVEMRPSSVTPKVKDRQPARIPAASRAFLLGLVAETAATTVTDPGCSSPPRHRQAMPVDRTAGGSMNIMKGTGGELRLRCVQTDADVPLCSDVLERVEAMDMSEDEAEEIVQVAPWHVQRWGENFKDGELESQGCSSPKRLRPSATADVIVSHPEVEVRPSTSGVTTSSKRVPRRQICDGSDLDSEFDDEFDISPVEIPGITGIGKEIPDSEELEEPVRDIINNIELGMDDEADRLLGTSSSFTWVEDFESFRAVREEFSGPTPGPLKDYDSPYDAFTDIWNKDIVELIAVETNRYANQTIETLKTNGELKPSSRLHGWTDTDADEIMLLFGVFMYMALDPRTSQSEYWISDDILDLPNFRRLMSYNRYVLLSKFLHFVDNADVSRHFLQTGEISSAIPSPKLAKLGPIIEHLGKKFSSLYNLGPNIYIDESLTLLKGRSSWVQTIRLKAARFGIKSYELCEAHTGYMARFQIYTGKSDGSGSDPSLSVDLGRKSTKVVLELLQGLEHRGHCVTMDNFYNCPSLARYLKSLGFDCLGTLRTNRRNVPSDIAKVPKNVRKGTITARHCGDVSIISWKHSKMVTIISTYHNDETFVGSKAGRVLVKPVCVRDYNRTMGGVDLKDQKLSKYLIERKRGVKWYMKMFKRLMNVSIHNAFIMYVSSLKRRNKLAVTHREFRYELARSLVRQHCPSQPELNQPVEQLMRLRRDIVHEPKIVNGRSARKRCVVCFRMKINKMVYSKCTTCDVFLCFENCWKNWHSSAYLQVQ